ncbi:MAG: preprotein translocase subunit YajC [Clostridiales bacterium]|nr:preprotein translocase subunit YajC [Clostridiales bacterium]
MILSLLSGSLNGSLAGAAEAATQAAEAATTASGQAAQSSGGFGPMFWIIYIVGLCLLFYFFAIRPNKKREAERQAVKESIKLGDWVVTTGGLYGKVVNVYQDEFMVEFGTNKSVTIPVRKEEILGVKEPNLSNAPAAAPASAEEVADEPKKKKKFGLF